VGIALRSMVYIIFRNFERERVGRDLRKMDCVNVWAVKPARPPPSSTANP
jgi:hypothetical protein